VAIRTDITDLKQLQVQLQQQRDQLEHTNRELEEFAIFASHDLQEPLRRVRSLVGLLRQRSGRLLDERSVGYLDQMAGSSERLQRLIRDLLNLSRLSHEEPHRRPVDLKEITRDVLADLEDTVTESHAQITVGDLPVLWADPVQLRLLMQNLVSNALKFSAPHRAPVVDIQALPEGPGRWRVEVRDNGVGLSDADIDQVFKPFKRVSPSVEPAGSGLGLTLCSRIIQRHQGRLWVQSVLGEGSRFCFVLSDEAPVPMPVPVPKAAPSLPARALRPDAATPGPKQAEQLP
jgi:light-regulated signal transduction histidine kinase (bacteriophytochrome)